jgi:serine/threonine-protein kinase
MDVMKAVVSGDVPPLSKVAPDVPEALAAIAQRALATRPEQRYQSAYEMAQALERFVAQSGEPIGAPALASYARRLFRAEVQLGPVLERSARAAELTRSSELVLPPLPPSLLGMAPLPSARPIPPPPFALTPSLALPTRVDPTWADFGELSDDLPRASTTSSELPQASFQDLANECTVPSTPVAPVGIEQPRPPARTLSMRVGRSVRHVAVAASLLAAALPLALLAHRSEALPRAPVAHVAEPLPERVGSAAVSPFTVIPSAPLAEGRKLPRLHPQLTQRSTLSINTRPWSTVYLGGKLLGTTPLADVAVPQGALMLKLVDRDGRVHVRRVAPSRKPRTAFFTF